MTVLLYIGIGVVGLAFYLAVGCIVLFFAALLMYFNEDDYEIIPLWPLFLLFSFANGAWVLLKWVTKGGARRASGQAKDLRKRMAVRVELRARIAEERAATRLHAD